VVSSPQFDSPEPLKSGPSDAAGGREPAQEPGRPTVDHDLLASVLKCTIAYYEGDAGLTNEERDEIQAVVRRHRGEALRLEPLVRELVEAVLRVEFRRRPAWIPLWPGISTRIAQALWEDPVSRGRLETLWDHLAKR